MSGIELYVLDGGGRAVPCWFPGELYIGGATVARGYLNDDALTAERFVPDTVSGEDRGRLYRTGDLVRSLPNGALVFLGRIDHQVKIRGFRVELGEIESALRRVDEIRDAVVVVHTDDGHGDRIVAYVVAANGAIDESALRATLGDELPDHMVPSRIVALDVLPLTPNGKLDRRGLPDPWQVGARAESSDGGQRNEWEAAVAELWRELLDTDDVSVDDNFYDLGGQSLLAIQMITALEKRTGLHMSPRELVFHTLRQFAALCAAKQESPLVDAGVGTPDTSKPAQDSV